MADHKSLVGVIYDEQGLHIRRIVVDAVDLTKHVGPGEKLATGLRAQGHDYERAREIVRRATGREPPSMQDSTSQDQRADQLIRVLGR